MARLYLFADESGNMDFRRAAGASKYFAVGTLLIAEEELPRLRGEMAALRDRLAWRNQGLDAAFHATEDCPEVRKEVFALLSDFEFRVDVTLLEKAKAQRHLYPDDHMFFKYAWYYHAKKLAPSVLRPDDELLVVAASLGTAKDRKTFRAAIEDVLQQCVPYRVKRTLAFWRDESDFALQAVDYCLWATTRRWERGDDSYYKNIADKVKTEYDLFKTGQVKYY